MNERFVAEPGTCETAFELKHLMEKFGPATGRYFATYPKSWVKLVYDHIEGWTDIEQARAKLVLRRAKDSHALASSGGAPYEDKETWVQNVARVQGSPLHFDGVVVSRPIAKNGVFPSLDDVTLPPTAAERVAAKAHEYCRVSQILLRTSPEIHFIDPYLDPCDSDRKFVLQEMLRIAATGQCQAAFLWVRADRLKRSVEETTRELERIARAAGYAYPRRLTLLAFTDACSSVKVHDRYLLSLHGAVRFEHGFQQLTGKRTASIEPVSLLSHEQLVGLFLEGEHDLKVEKVELKP